MTDFEATPSRSSPCPANTGGGISQILLSPRGTRRNQPQSPLNTRRIAYARTPTFHVTPVTGRSLGVRSGRPGILQQATTRHHREVDVAGIRGHAAETTLAPGATPPARAHWKPLTPIEDFLKRTDASVLLQTIPTSTDAHPRAVVRSLSALHRAVHVVTATKSLLITHWRELEEAVRNGRSGIRISGATGAALPMADLARMGVRGLGCLALRRHVVQSRLPGVSVAQEKSVPRAEDEADPVIRQALLPFEGGKRYVDGNGVRI
jgi:hypothetical protein